MATGSEMNDPIKTVIKRRRMLLFLMNFRLFSLTSLTIYKPNSRLYADFAPRKMKEVLLSFNLCQESSRFDLMQTSDLFFTPRT